MFQSFQNIFRIPELRKKILFTLLIFLIYRVGGHVPAPGIDARALGTFFAQAKGTLFGLYDLFVGGNLSRATIFALGIMPYISASIIIQLLGSVIPYLEKLQKEGEEGRKKITQYTRYGTVGLAAIQSLGISIFLESLTTGNGAPVVPHPGIGFRLLTMLTLTSGTIFVMWLGEQITAHGIGNGISLLIFVGCLDDFFPNIAQSYTLVQGGGLNLFALVLIGLLMVAVTGSVVLVTMAQRRIPVQYAKRIVGRKVYGGQNTYIPLNVNAAGVIPIIFAQSLIMFPGTFATYFKNVPAMEMIAGLFDPAGLIYNVIYAGLIIFFAYFYTAIAINPQDLSDNMKKYGGFIPGVRPGAKTAEFIDRILTRITLPGAIFFAFIAVLPSILIQKAHVPFYFGGTTLLIIVGVALDTLQQIESHLLMRHYEGFIKKGKIRGRRYL
jgi:preprotein translocase subunit SecY